MKKYRVVFVGDLSEGKWWLQVWRPRMSVWSGIKAFDTKAEAEATCFEYNRRGEE